MSAGAFVDGKYEDDDGNVYACRIQPETLDLSINNQTNILPTAATDQPIAARMTGSRRAYGVRARSVRVRFTGAPPEGYKAASIIELPIFRLDRFNAMKAVKKATGTYLGASIVAVGYTAESVK